MNAIQRPTLDENEQAAIRNAFLKIRQMGYQKALIYLLNCLNENAILLKEVNQHRAALGIEPLPAFKPTVK